LSGTKILAEFDHQPLVMIALRNTVSKRESRVEVVSSGLREILVPETLVKRFVELVSEALVVIISQFANRRTRCRYQNDTPGR
jgi:hypothetical protein